MIDWFRQQTEQAGGGNHQMAIDQALCEHIDRQSLEALLRRVVCEDGRRGHRNGTR